MSTNETFTFFELVAHIYGSSYAGKMSTIFFVVAVIGVVIAATGFMGLLYWGRR